MIDKNVSISFQLQKYKLQTDRQHNCKLIENCSYNTATRSTETLTLSTVLCEKGVGLYLSPQTMGLILAK